MTDLHPDDPNVPKAVTLREFASFGAGVQSSAIALLALNRDARLLAVSGGVVPERYFFADVGDEPPEVYAQLARFERMVRRNPAPYQIRIGMMTKMLPSSSGEVSRPGEYWVLIEKVTASPLMTDRTSRTYL